MPQMAVAPDSGDMYVKVSGEKIRRTLAWHPAVLIDVDADGRVVGVEILADRVWEPPQ